MPFLALPIIWSWVSSGWVGFVLPLLKLIPWQVWAAIGLALAFMYYGSVREKRGYAACTAQVQEATRIEETHRLTAANQALQEAQRRASESARRAQELQGELNDVQLEVGKLKTAKNVCLPSAVTDKFGRSRVRR